MHELDSLIHEYFSWLQNDRSKKKVAERSHDYARTYVASFPNHRCDLEGRLLGLDLSSLHRADID